MHIYCTALGQRRNGREEQGCKEEEVSQQGKHKNRTKHRSLEERQVSGCTETERRQPGTTTTELPVINPFIDMAMHQSRFLEKKYPNILCGCMWILTWAWDRTRGSRLNYFYKKGKGKKKNIWVLITHGRQIQNETANSHATDTSDDLFTGLAATAACSRQAMSAQCTPCLPGPTHPSCGSCVQREGSRCARVCLAPFTAALGALQLRHISPGKYRNLPGKRVFSAPFIEGNFLWWI